MNLEEYALILWVHGCRLSIEIVTIHLRDRNFGIRHVTKELVHYLDIKSA